MDGTSLEPEADLRMVQAPCGVDVETGCILAYVVTEPYYKDSLAFERLMNIVLDAGHRVSVVLADAAYDKKAYWN